MLSASPQSKDSHPTSDGYVMVMASRWATIALIIVLELYVVCGAFLFRAFERDHEMETIAKVKELYENLTREMASVPNEKSTQLLKTFHEFLQLSGQYSEMEGLKATQPKWNFEGAFFFCYTVVTTIGYGKIAPATAHGRVACIWYGLFGIPLCLTVLHQISAYSRQCAIWLRIGTTLHRHRICVGVSYLLVGVLLIYLPSILISYEEDWTYRDSVYYVFVTVFTVGFGDLIAGQKASTIPLYRYFLAFWFLLGIAFMTSTMRFLNGLDMKLVQFCSRKVYIKSHQKDATTKSIGAPSPDHRMSMKDEEDWAVKVQ